MPTELRPPSLNESLVEEDTAGNMKALELELELVGVVLDKRSVRRETSVAIGKWRLTSSVPR